MVITVLLKTHSAGFQASGVGVRGGVIRILPEVLNTVVIG